MNFLRSCLHAIWSFVVVVPTAFWMIAATPFANPHQMFRYAKFFLHHCLQGLRVLCGVNWRVTGLEHLPSGDKAPAILLVKHQSVFETFLMPLIMPRDLAYVFKKELLYVPFFGWGIGRCDMIHIDRSKRNEAFSKVVDQGKRLLNKGVWVIMFPEGTRIARGQAGNYKTGGARLAIATGAPVIPIAVSSAKCWPRKAFTKTPGMVDIVIGPPIPSVGRDADSLIAEVQAWIEAEMRRIDAGAYAPLGAGAVSPALLPADAAR